MLIPKFSGSWRSLFPMRENRLRCLDRREMGDIQLQAVRAMVYLPVPAYPMRYTIVFFILLIVHQNRWFAATPRASHVMERTRRWRERARHERRQHDAHIPIKTLGTC